MKVLMHSDVKWTTTCPRCSCFFEYEPADLKGHEFYVICPDCGRAIYHPEHDGGEKCYKVGNEQTEEGNDDSEVNEPASTYKEFAIEEWRKLLQEELNKWGGQQLHPIQKPDTNPIVPIMPLDVQHSYHDCSKCEWYKQHYGEIVVGDTPCTWCENNRVTCNTMCEQTGLTESTTCPYKVEYHSTKVSSTNGKISISNIEDTKVTNNR